jgi:mono/diheme cytochrome c family protein
MPCSFRVIPLAVPLASALWLAGLPASSARAAAPARAVDFNRDIRPILSDNCFQCHGPDEKARKARLRLDVKEGAFAPRQDGPPVIVPGRSAASELVRRITAPDPDDVMPPPESNRQLTPRQIELLTRWVEQGARWDQHWAFVAPARPALPPVKNRRWPRNGIDYFVLARLEKERLPPAPEADRERLIRRVSLDLTGLPPTPAEVDAFVRDRAPDAYEKVVDRLLASPRFGERLASEWLDLARYADTHGYQMDRYRPMWPYRDWVIRAFNGNLPFDQFVTWQLAGDLLPDATKDQRLATAFNRLHMQNEEGGIVEEEFRVAYVVDRVNTFGTAFLGLTLDCSRCHDHKFDPLTMRDFYSLFAFFQNIDESGQTVYFGEVMPVPTLLLSTAAQDATLAELKRRITVKEREVAALREQARGAFERWLGVVDRAGLAKKAAGLVGAFSFDEVVSNKVANAAEAAKPGKVQDSFQLVPGRGGQAALLDGENGFTFPGLGAFTRADPFTLALWLATPTNAPRLVVAHKSRAWMDAGSRGYEIVLEDGHVAVGLHHMWPGNALKVRTRAALPTNEWTHVAFTYDGSSRAAGVNVYVNGRAAAVKVIRDGLWKDFTYGGGEPDLAIGHRFRDNGFKGGRVDEFQVFNRALTPLEVAHLAGRGDFTEALTVPVAALTAAQRDALFDWFLATVHEPAQKLAAELHALRAGQSRFIEPIPEAMVMEEMPQPKPAFLLKRGAYDAPGERVAADTPRALPPFPAGAPRNRLGLARWLLDPGHPLLARVTVNRAWQMMFGHGLVTTSDNFGSQGAPPTHPELLDWLAREFVEPGTAVEVLNRSTVGSEGAAAVQRFNDSTPRPWDLKRLLKLIALSATYRQSSVAAPDLLARDPPNALLARGPARRLSAEMLRDQALAVSGLLVEKLGGPSVKPYQPPGLWEIAMGNPKYDQGQGDDLRRRSLYTFWKRTVPHPVMVTFDAADRSNCAAQRQSTSTPLQALALLNDVQIVEAARHVSQRMLTEGGQTLDDQVAWAFRLVTGRRPAAREAAVLKQLFTEQRGLFAADPPAAAKLLAVGEAKNVEGLDRVDLAAGAALALALLNHDEAVLRR